MTTDGTFKNLTDSGHAAAPSPMTDPCTVTRFASHVLNETTLVYADTYTTVYTGVCRVKGTALQDQASNAGERPAVTREYDVSLPVSAIAVAVDDLITITASQLDAVQPGLTLRVLGVLHGSQITARRMRCQEVTA